MLKNKTGAWPVLGLKYFDDVFYAFSLSSSCITSPCTINK